MSEIYCVINGEFVLKSAASILISDLSIQRGFGIFDFFRTVNNQPLFLEDHLQRFYFSASEMGMDAGYSRDEIKKLLQQLIDKNKIANSGIRITLTGGYAEDGFTPANPNLLISQTPFNFNYENFDNFHNKSNYYLEMIENLKKAENLSKKDPYTSALVCWNLSKGI